MIAVSHRTVCINKKDCSECYKCHLRFFSFRFFFFFTAESVSNASSFVGEKLNKNSDYCYIPRSSKHTFTCK